MSEAKPLSFGPRIRIPKDERQVKPAHRERGSTRNFRAAAFEHPDGRFQQTQHNLESEEGKMNEMNETAREKKLAEIAETVEKFKAENPEAAARAEAEAAAWVQKQMKKQYPFENAVETLRAAGASLSDAIRKAAAANPADHDDYLRRAAEGSARPLAGPR